MKRKITTLVASLIVTAASLPAQNILYVNSAADDNAVGTLRRTIANAAEGDSIVIETTVPEIVLSLGTHIQITNKSLKINGQGATVRVPNPGVSPARLFYVESKDGAVHSFSLYNLDLKGGNTQQTPAPSGGTDGGAILINNGTVNFTMKNCTISDTKAQTGGAIMMKNPDQTSVYIENCTFKNNEVLTKLKDDGVTLQYGNGAVGMLRGNDGITIKNCVFESNKAWAGAVTILSEPATFSGCYFKNNSALDSQNGASVAALVLGHTTGTSIIENCTFEGNVQDNATDGSDGNAVIVTTQSGTAALITNSTFYNNTGKRGAIYASAGTLTVVNSTFAGNIGTNATNNKYGSALFIRNAAVTLVNNIFAYNYDANNADIFVNNGNTATTGSNNIIAKAVLGGTGANLNNLLNPVAFAYESATPGVGDNPLFATYTTIGGKKAPVLNATSKTIPLAANSVAIGEGVASFTGVTIPTLDQLGVLRGTLIDLGSSEYNATTGIRTMQYSSKAIVYSLDNGIYMNAISGDAIQQVSVYNLQGQLLRNDAVNANAHIVNGLAKGIYLVKVTAGNEIQTQKITVK